MEHKKNPPIINVALFASDTTVKHVRIGEKSVAVLGEAAVEFLSGLGTVRIYGSSHDLIELLEEALTELRESEITPAPAPF